jgi:hypothetical protein
LQLIWKLVNIPKHRSWNVMPRLGRRIWIRKNS